METKNLIEQLELLIHYERTDIPEGKKEQTFWSFYTTQKIVEFLGAEPLTYAFNLPLTSLQSQTGPNIYRIIQKKLCSKTN